MREVFRLSASTPRHRPECDNAPDRQVRLPPAPPRRRRIGQLHPVELGFRPGRMLDYRHPRMRGYRSKGERE
jgi:hypothetical protein